MADRIAQRTAPTIERRPPVATTAQRPTRTVPTSPAQALQQRLGNQATQALVARVSPAVQVERNTAQRPSPGLLERQAGSSPTQAKTVGVVSAKESPAGVASKISSPTSAPTAPGPLKPQTVAPSATKPVVKPVAEGPGKSALGHRDAQVAGGGPADKKAGAQAEGPPSPREAVSPAIAAVQQRAAGAQKHSPAGVPVASAQAAAINPQAEQKRSAAAQTVANLHAAEAEGIKRDKFKADLKRAIAEATEQPKTESDAERVMKSGATQASGTLRGQLKSEADTAAGPMQSAATSEVPASSQPAPPVTALQSEPVGPAPVPVSAAPVVPASLPPERLDYSADRGPTEQVMAENNLTKDQMQEASDPAFGPTLTARASAEKHEAAAAAKYRQGEGKVQDQAEATAAQSLSKDLAGIHGIRTQQLGKVGAQQLGTKAKDAQERQRVTDTINGIKDKTRTDVETILASMETEASNIFETGLKRAEKAYEDAFEEAKGGIGTWLTTWGDDWEKHIEQSLATARRQYLHEVDAAIDEVSTFVEGKLKAAKQRVADGRKEVENFFNGLDASVKQFGEEALQAVSADFDTMGSDIDQRRDNLINKLTEQYKASHERMSAMEEKLREENKSLWQRVYDATVGLVKKIIEFKNMLLGILGKAAAVIGDIIAHPIQFLGNLVAGVMQGLKNFMSKIGTYLIKGLMDWLFGALAGAGLQLPEKFDLQGVISIVLQILGLTYASFRARAVAIVGEPVVAALEKAAEVFKVVLTEGIPGLWRFIKDQSANLKSMVLDAIFDYIKDKVIMAGITWIIGLLNPASAFFKACKAIYDIVMFFVNRGSQILALVNAVIDSMAAIAKGSIGVAATFVENALAKAIPVAIGFLASLLGLGDPSKPVRGFIEKAQAPVNKAIDWVINLAVKGVKGLVAMGAGASPEEKQRRVDQAATAALAAVSKYSGKAVDAVILKPLLLAIRVRYRLTSLEPVKQGEYWAIRAEINPVKTVMTSVKAGKDIAEMEVGYEPHWPLDEFMSKAEAIKKAAEGKTANQAKTLGFETGSTTKRKSTKELRQGGQEAFRTEIHAYIDRITVKADQDRARKLMAQLQADHQQELQMGGTDDPSNMAMIESRMNSQMGAMWRGQLKDLPAETKIVKVNIEQKTGTAKGQKHRKSGAAAELQALLLVHAKALGTSVTTIKDWFKL